MNPFGKPLPTAAMRKFLCAAMLAVVGLVGSTSHAGADFQLRLSDSIGTTPRTITDNGAGDSNPNAGVITFNGSFGAYLVTFTAALSKPVSGSVAEPNMDLNFLVAKAAGSVADTITIETSDTDFTTSPLSLGAAVGGTFGGPISQVTYQTFSGNNTNFDESGSSSALLTFTSSPFSGTSTLNVPAGSPYSLTEKVVITGASGFGSSSGDGTLSVPAPANLAGGFHRPALVGVRRLAASPEAGLNCFRGSRRS
jgi:hypothetical protein